MTALAEAPRARAVQFGRYQLLAPIGYGGMAEIWKARLPGPGGFAKKVVVKRILPHLSHNPSFVAMFTSEAALLSRLEHPNIVQVFEFSAVDGELYIAMEYVDGLNISDLVRKTGPLPIGLALYLVREACRALSYAHALSDEHGHSQGFIHRDVSPSNLMLATDGRVKLLDFGIAKAVHHTDELTRSGVIKGKLGYMAPEAVAGEVVDLRADVFSIGVVLHELLTGARLFRGRDEMATMAQVIACKVAPPSTLRAGVSSALDAICMRALARDREERYQSCEELVRALGDELARTPWDAAASAAFVKERGLAPRVDLEPIPATASALSPELPKGDEPVWTLRNTLLVIVTTVLLSAVAVAWRVRRVTHSAVPLASPTLPRELELPAPPTLQIATSTPAKDVEVVRSSPAHASIKKRARAKRQRVDLLHGDIIEAQ